MNGPQKITAAASAAVVVGLVALAAPAVAGSVAEVASWQSPVPAAAPAADSEPVVEVAEAEPADEVVEQVAYDCDGPIMPPYGATPVDQGSRVGASGDVVLVDGIPSSYTVAANDDLVAIGDRFCIDYATIGPLNGGPIDMIHPGDVLVLRP